MMYELKAYFGPGKIPR